MAMTAAKTGIPAVSADRLTWLCHQRDELVDQWCRAHGDNPVVRQQVARYLAFGELPEFMPRSLVRAQEALLEVLSDD